MVDHVCCAAIFLLTIIIFELVSGNFVRECEVIVMANSSSYSCESTREKILHYYQERINGESGNYHGSSHRFKRNDVTTFRGHPKTREERWHANFNLNWTNLELEQTHSLVILLNKVMDKYLNACIPIILYDKFVEDSEGIILQLFFRVCGYIIHIWFIKNVV